MKLFILPIYIHGTVQCTKEKKEKLFSSGSGSSQSLVKILTVKEINLELISFCFLFNKVKVKSDSKLLFLSSWVPFPIFSSSNVVLQIVAVSLILKVQQYDNWCYFYRKIFFLDINMVLNQTKPLANLLCLYPKNTPNPQPPPPPLSIPLHCRSWFMFVSHDLSSFIFVTIFPVHPIFYLQNIPPPNLILLLTHNDVFGFLPNFALAAAKDSLKTQFSLFPYFLLKNL